MHRLGIGLGCAAALLVGVLPAQAQGQVKIGLLNVCRGSSPTPAPSSTTASRPT